MIRIPRLNANDDQLLVADVLVQVGDTIEPGQAVAIVESSKATSPVQSKCHATVIAVLAEVGQRLDVGQPLLRIELRLATGETENSQECVPSVPPWVDALRRKALPLEGGRTAGEPGWTIEAQALYLGDDVHLGQGVQLKADTVVLADGARIGADVVLHSGEILIDEGAHIAARTRADLSGGRTASSRLALGAASLIAEEVRLNTCRSVIIGEQSAISPRAMLFTHSYWQSVLEGYPARFGDINIADKSWVGAGCQILPGVNIGPGVVVMSNSTVVNHVEAETMVAGVPAKVIRSDLKRNLGTTEKASILKHLLIAFSEELSRKGCTVRVHGEGAHIHVERDDFGCRNVWLLESEASSSSVGPDDIVLSLGAYRPAHPEQPHFSVRELRFTGREDALVCEVRNALRRHGIRFKPLAWNSDHRRGLR